MSRTAAVEIPPEVLNILALPALPGLDEDRAAGRVCIWGGESLTIETAVDLGERQHIAGGRWFPRACHAHTGRRALQALMDHAPLCERCADDAGSCETGIGLRRLMKDGRRSA
ncbi:hypothetical protein ACFXAZ_15885 [Streptomyces sp. NPDC059477]|uniref:hypothetical protein n=1 Tax=Streptomyces sp. NPDC059477 TaxID=3346847 RepID=UPI00368DF72B